MRSDTGSEEVQRFGWIRDSALHEAACLTFVRGKDIDRVAMRFGAVAGHVGTFDFPEFCEEAFAHQDQYPMIGLRRVGDWLLVLEDDWSEGARPEVLRRVSNGSEAVSAFWNAHSLTRFSYAVDGEVRTTFEALMPHVREGARPDALEEVRAGLPWPAPEQGDGGADTAALMLALSARVTGAALTPDWFDGQFVTYPVAPWPEDLPDAADAVLELVATTYPPELVTALRAADQGARRRAVVAVVRLVLDSADCLGHEVINETIAAMATERDFDRRAISEVVRMWDWKLHRERSTSRDRGRVRAAEVLRQATNADPLVAIFAALSAARGVRGIETGALADVVCGVLADR